MRELRLTELCDLVAERGAVRVEEASEALGVSRETIRRDLATLAERGLVQRTHGGAAVSGRVLTERSVSERESENGQAKEAIAALVASELVEDGMAIMLDGGTTAAAVARRLAGRQLTVVTSSLAIAASLMPTTTDVVLLGGQLRERSGMTVGPLAEAVCALVHCDAAFLSGPALSARGGLMDSYAEGVQIKGAMLAHSDSAYIITDSSKLGRTAFLKVCDLADVTAVVTDGGADPAAIDELRVSGATVLTAPMAVTAGIEGKRHAS
ncbi:MAG: DeoR/GlpR family DNA-binding transcription regulator [Actinobacteria bacterium]|nr:DeoR/GlpR family DNA-binding transcription regulator [Actinomycetota bacterium]